MSQSLGKQLVLGGIPLILFVGTFDQAIGAFENEISDKSKAIFVNVDTQSKDGNTTILAIGNDWKGNVDDAKEKVQTLSRGDLNKYFGDGVKSISFIASIGKKQKYAAADHGFQRTKIDHAQMLRKLGEVFLDKDGFVKGATGGLTTVIFYTKDGTSRADFAWNSNNFLQVMNDFGRNATRHTTIGQQAVMIAEVGTSRMLLATSRDISEMLHRGDGQVFRHPIEIRGNVQELALAQQGNDGTYTVLVTTDKKIIPLTVTFDALSTPKVTEQTAQAIDVDSQISSLGGVIKVTGNTAIFFGKNGLAYAPIKGFQPDAQRLFQQGTQAAQAK